MIDRDRRCQIKSPCSGTDADAAAIAVAGVQPPTYITVQDTRTIVRHLRWGGMDGWTGRWCGDRWSLLFLDGPAPALGNLILASLHVLLTGPSPAHVDPIPVRDVRRSPATFPVLFLDEIRQRAASFTCLHDSVRWIRRFGRRPDPSALNYARSNGEDQIPIIMNDYCPQHTGNTSETWLHHPKQPSSGSLRDASRPAH